MSEHKVWAAIKIMLFCNVYDYLVYERLVLMPDYKYQNVLLQLLFQKI